MVPSTRFVGHLQVTPPLNAAERQFLAAFRIARRCDWVTCDDGCCLSYVGRGRVQQAVSWLRFLIANLLGPEAEAQRDTASDDETAHTADTVDTADTARRYPGFGFDHRLDGVVVAHRPGPREPFVISVVENRVVGESVRPPHPGAEAIGFAGAGGGGATVPRRTTNRDVVVALDPTRIRRR